MRRHKATAAELAALGEPNADLVIEAGMPPDYVDMAAALKDGGVRLRYGWHEITVQPDALDEARTWLADIGPDEIVGVIASVKRRLDRFQTRANKAHKRGKMLPKTAYDDFMADCCLWHVIHEGPVAGTA